MAIDRTEFVILASMAFLSLSFALFGMMWVSGFGAGILFSIFLFEPPQIKSNVKQKGDGS